MQILYIIGNGFDLNLGLKTSYNDFYNYYKTVESNKTSVSKLKENILEKYDSWSDLELALGDYTQHLKSIAELDEILLDVGEELSKYLRLEEQKLDNQEFDQQQFFNYLSFPEKVLLPADKEKLFNFKKKWENYEWNLDIYIHLITHLLSKRYLETYKEMWY